MQVSKDPWDRSDQCLLHQRFGLDLFIPPIDLSCFASRHLYNTCAAGWLSSGRTCEGLKYKLIIEKWYQINKYSFIYLLLFYLNVPSGLWLWGESAEHFLSQLVLLNSVLESNMFVSCLRTVWTGLMRIHNSHCHFLDYATVRVILRFWQKCTGKHESGDCIYYSVSSTFMGIMAHFTGRKK